MSVLYTRSNAVSPDPRVEKEVSTFIDSGYKVEVLAWDRENTYESFSKINVYGSSVKITRAKIKSSFGAGISNLLPLLKFQIFLMCELFKKRKKYQVIHAADFDTVLPAVLAKLLLRKKVVYDIYDFYVDAFNVPVRLKGLIRWLDFKVINYVDAVIIASESRVEQIAGSNAKKLIIIHNTPLEIQSIPDWIEDGPDSYDVVVSYVGVLQDHRLLLEVLDVFKRNPRWRLNIAGFGLLEAIFKDASHKYSNIYFYGKVPYSKGLEISKSADILFATYDPKIANHRYSSPNKLYEAMFLSKPIIVCKDTGIDRLVLESNIGFVSDYSSEGFESAVNSLMSENSLYKMGERARDLYDNCYSWTVMERRLNKLYKEIMRGR